MPQTEALPKIRKPCILILLVNDRGWLIHCDNGMVRSLFDAACPVYREAPVNGYS